MGIGKLLNRKKKIEQIRISLPKETSEALSNPDCGGYYIYDFLITDNQEDYDSIIPILFGVHSETNLALIEVDLSNYRNGPISYDGLSNINSLFKAISMTNKRMILRFLYDRNGKAFETEPKNINIIFTHMGQLKEIVRTYSDSIYTMQGLFIGNWGEMHGSRYSTDREICLLAEKLVSTTEKFFLSVRTPSYWRLITSFQGDLIQAKSGVIGSRFGLYNDGIFGNEYDTGTYGGASKANVSYSDKWLRSEEIEFQNELCRDVPNGGEVILPGRFNDLENAICDMRNMHISYLNLGYDAEVWNKWANCSVSEDSVFDGMDGKTYIERHLGYRFVIKNINIMKKRLSNTVILTLSIANYGFAPIYESVTGYLELKGKEHSYSYVMDGNLKQLSGKMNETSELKSVISVNDIESDDYRILFHALNCRGSNIEFGNCSENGMYQLGVIQVR